MPFQLMVRFLFFKQKTAYEMRISDWSSDVCSSDLLGIEKLDAIGVSNSRFLAENIKAGEICHLWLPIRVMASSRKARMGGKEVRTSLSNRQTGTCSCIAWL